MHVSLSVLFAVTIAASPCLVQGAPVAHHSRTMAPASLARLWTRAVEHVSPRGSQHNFQLPHNLHPAALQSSTATCHGKPDQTVPDLPANETVTETPTSQYPGTSPKQSCFPALDFAMPDDTPASLDGWWCNMEDEYAFLGFSYDVSACQSQEQLNREFLDARNTFNSRYIRMYGACDQENHYDRIVEAAWNAGLGVQALVWFGFDGDDKWKGRKTRLFNSLKSK